MISRIPTRGRDPIRMGEDKEMAGQVAVRKDGGVRAWVTIAGWLQLAGIIQLYWVSVLVRSYQGCWRFSAASTCAKLSPDYYTRVFLKSHSPSSIAWMGSFQLAMPFACGIITGKLFDAGYFHSVMIGGAIIYIFSCLCSRLHTKGSTISQGLGIGIGVGLFYAPTTSVISWHFTKRRALAIGVAFTGVSLGAVVFPIRSVIFLISLRLLMPPFATFTVLNHLFESIGFARAVRVSGYICIGCIALGNALVRLPPGHRTVQRAPADLKKFVKDLPYMFFCIGSLVAMLGFFFPVVYLQLYAVEHNIDGQLSFYSLAILNGAGIFGRIGGNYLADIYGVWCIYVPSTLATGVTIWAVLGRIVWLASGAWLSLTMAGLASLSPSPQEVGARVGGALAVAAVGVVISAPVQGALLTSDLVWIRPIAFSGSSMFIATIFYGFTGVLVARRKREKQSGH
ncbi:major facilitator superfamily domain-containing protein [Infundibulicybe gibba]|nr:major facilitator superfamily domain-containing protein [Infundibulicybe gibba]